MALKLLEKSKSKSILDEKENDVDDKLVNKNNLTNREKLIEHNNRVLNQLVPGDLVQYRRGLYSHWAVYVGNEKVIHLHTKGEGTHISTITIFSANLAGLAEVKVDYFWNILQNSYAYRNNTKDNEMTPLQSHQIVMRAYSKLGSDFYDLFSYNCEHFANWCRYNLPISDQAETFIKFGHRVTRDLRNIHGYLRDKFTKNQIQLEYDINDDIDLQNNKTAGDADVIT